MMPSEKCNAGFIGPKESLSASNESQIPCSCGEGRGSGNRGGGGGERNLTALFSDVAHISKKKKKKKKERKSVALKRGLENWLLCTRRSVSITSM